MKLYEFEKYSGMLQRGQWKKMMPTDPFPASYYMFPGSAWNMEIQHIEH